MNNYTFAAETIKERVSMRDAIALYAPSPAPRRNRIPCPIHAGENFNLSFTDRLYHCFVCGAGGDVISFVQHIFDLPFPAALDKLNTDFNCGAILDRRPTLREQREAEKRHRRRLEARALQKEISGAYEGLHSVLMGLWCWHDCNRIDYAPQNMEDEFHPLFVEALHRIDHVEYLLNDLYLTDSLN